ncbi:NAD(P)-dependent oxidoreductase [Roseateles sp.]|uniref:NAD-dependent epimerase/dehydratase family protein n=1 Tax=Roseateles sp. TaxID=1971397 RepID=UPI002E006E0E|nr:NAD(P)-dependent oxidoreductase [Roseateles sp.]
MTANPARPARCLITGASGYIGGRLRERLVEHGGPQHVALVRSPAAAAAMRAGGGAAVAADLLEPQSLASALQGCDTVIHLAHGDRGPQATRHLVEAAVRQQVRRFVHISTMSVHGPAPGPEAAHEATARIGRYGEPYSDSKAEQEEIVQAAHDRGDLPVVILRPTVVYGLGGHFERQVLAQARAGEVTSFDGGSGLCNAVFVDDVCDAIEAALVRDEALGEAMFVTADRAITWGEFIRAFAAQVEPAPRFVDLSAADAKRYWAEHPPEPVGGIPARVWRKLKRLAGWQPPVAPWPPLGRVMRETFPIAFSNEKARRLLGWAPRVDFPQGVALTRDWLRAHADVAR